jgi:hypothetical protein
MKTVLIKTSLGARETDRPTSISAYKIHYTVAADFFRRRSKDSSDNILSDIIFYIFCKFVAEM